MIKVVNYLDNKNISKDIIPLFLEAFPEDERPSEDIFISSFKKKSNQLYGFYDDKTFVGFASVILYKDICYIFFLAVTPLMRNKGYGSKILHLIKDFYKDKTLLLCYEDIDEKYHDVEIRRKREKFYLNNGFKKNPLKTNEFGVIFQTAYSGTRTVSFEEYQQIFIEGFGKWSAHFLKKEQ